LSTAPVFIFAASTAPANMELVTLAEPIAVAPVLSIVTSPLMATPAAMFEALPTNIPAEGRALLTFTSTRPFSVIVSFNTSAATAFAFSCAWMAPVTPSR